MLERHDWRLLQHEPTTSLEEGSARRLREHPIQGRAEETTVQHQVGVKSAAFDVILCPLAQRDSE